MTNTTILHFTESLGGGVASAISSYRAATPEMEHHLVGVVRHGELHPERTEGFASTTLLTRGPSALRGLRRLLSRVRPDVVHLHSSFAGAAGRLPAVIPKGVAVVYTPHCYSFERGDLVPLVRRAIRGVERRLAGRAHVVAACSRSEERLARELGSRSTAYIPNASAAVLPQAAAVPSQTTHRIGVVGRASAQKDPEFFVALSREPSLRDVEFTWIGDGSPAFRSALDRAGIRVTGWLDEGGVMTELQSLSAYAHTAAWEGFPISVLEAHRAGKPVIVRSIDAFRDLPSALHRREPGAMGIALREILDDDAVRHKNVSAWSRAVAMNTLTHQGEALRKTYAKAVIACQTTG